MPNPRKLSEVSIKIAADISRVAFTTITPIEFGSMCLNMILKFDAPATRAASTNSLSRSARNSALTSLASPVQAIRPRRIPSDQALPPKVRPRTAPRTKVGIMIMVSVKRIKRLSSQPRKNPATDPMTTPNTVEIRPTRKITVRDCWVPRMTRAKMSLPKVS